MEGTAIESELARDTVLVVDDDVMARTTMGLDLHAEPLQGRIPGTPGTTYLQKPYSQAQLKAALDRVIGELSRR